MFLDATTERLFTLRDRCLDGERRERTIHCLLDWIGVALAGSCQPAAAAVAAYALREYGAGPATVLGSGRRSSVTGAILANAMAGHVLDYDDVSLAMWGHPSAVVVPAALAVAEAQRSNGRQLLEAISLGIEACCALGEALTESHYKAGWHATATLGAFGAAAAAGVLLKLPREQLTHALAIAASQASGMQAFFATDIKPYQVARAAASGVEAAYLAGTGLQARGDVIECRRGFSAMYGGAAAPALSGAQGVMQVERVLFKYHASCFGTHAPAEAARELTRRLPGPPTAAESILVSVPGRYLDMCNIANPQSEGEAKFSIRFVCAASLAGKQTGSLDAFQAHNLFDPQVRQMLPRIAVEADDALPDAGARIVAMLKCHDGLRGFTVSVDLSAPEKDLPFQAERLHNKFIALAGPVVGAERAGELAEAIATVHGNPGLASLSRLLVPASPQRAVEECTG